MSRSKYKIVKIRPPSKSIAPFAIALMGGTCYSALCWDDKTAEIICAALNASEGGVKNRQQAKVMSCLCTHRDLEGMRYDLQIVKECPQHGHFHK